MNILKYRKFIMKKYRDLSLPVKASLWFTICSIVQKGISVISMPIFTRLMNTEQYGEYNIFLTWYNILLLVVTLNVHTEIFNKGLIDHDKDKDTFTVNQAGLLVFLAFFFIVLYFLFHDFFNQIFELSTSLVIIMILEILGSSIVALWTARERFDFEYRKIVFVTILMAVLTQGLGIIAVILLEDKASAKIYTNALVPITISIIIMYLFLKRVTSWGYIKWWKASILGALPLLPHYLSLVLLNQSDKLLINHFLGSREAAIYSVAHSAGLLMTIVNNSINGSFVPWAYDKMKYQNGHKIKEISNSLFILIIIVNVGLIWIAPEAIKLLAASQYSDAVYCLVPIAMSVYFYFVYTLLVDIEIYYGEGKYVAIASIIAAILNLGLNYFLIPIFDYFVAGYVTLFSYVVTMVLHFIFLSIVMKKRSKMIKDVFSLKNIIIDSFVLIIFSGLGVILYPYILIRYIVIFICLFLMFKNRGKLVMLIKMKG